MVLHTCLPEGFAGVPARHSELQCVLAQRLCARDKTAGVRGMGQALPLALLNPFRAIWAVSGSRQCTVTSLGTQE